MQTIFDTANLTSANTIRGLGVVNSLMTTRETYEWAYRNFRINRDNKEYAEGFGKAMKEIPFRKRTSNQNTMMKALSSFRNRNAIDLTTIALVDRKAVVDKYFRLSYFDEMTAFWMKAHDRLAKGIVIRDIN